MNVMTKMPRSVGQQPPTVNFIDHLMRITVEYKRIEEQLHAAQRAHLHGLFDDSQALAAMGPPWSVGTVNADFLKRMCDRHQTPLGWLDHEEMARIAGDADTSKPAYGQGAWDKAASRVFSRLKPIEPVLRDLRRELLSSVREWPRCRQHDVDCSVFYRRTQLQGDPLVYAAFACDKCLVSQPFPWNGKLHRDASTF